jgi:hypothetical protein
MSSPADLIQAGLALGELGRAVASGQVPDPIEVARAISAVAVALVPIEDMKSYLDDAARRRADLAAELAATAKLGPRP